MVRRRRRARRFVRRGEVMVEEGAFAFGRWMVEAPMVGRRSSKGRCGGQRGESDDEKKVERGRGRATTAGRAWSQ
jgi:hypothetical protein